MDDAQTHLSRKGAVPRAGTLPSPGRLFTGALAGALILASGCAVPPATPPRPPVQAPGGAAFVAVEEVHVTPPADAPAAGDPAPAPALEEQPAPAEEPALEPSTSLPFDGDVERWRPQVRLLLQEALDEGRLWGPANAMDEDLLLALIQQESSGDPQAESPVGAAGLMQLMPETFAEMMDLPWWMASSMDQAAIWDTSSNLRAGIRYLAMALQEQGGSFYWALASYNAGIGAVHSWRAAGFTAVPAWGGYEETANYAPSILRNYAEHHPGAEVHIPTWQPAPPRVPVTVAPARVAPPPPRPAPPPARPAAPAPQRPAPVPQKPVQQAASRPVQPAPQRPATTVRR